MSKNLQHRYVRIDGKIKKFPVYDDENAAAVIIAIKEAFKLDTSTRYDMYNDRGERVKGHILVNTIPGELQLVKSTDPPPAAAPLEWDLDDAEAMPNTIPVNTYR